MTPEILQSLKYPVGPCVYRASSSQQERMSWIAELAACPFQMRAALEGLSEAQLDTPYRPGGWTIRQVAHHVPDSHLNAYVRFKLALTEDTPTIKPYAEAAWAKLPDTAATPVEVSLDLLENLHMRWVLLLEHLSGDDFARKFNHPESGTMTLDMYLGSYAWHCRHHVAHITGLRTRMRW